ncbi:hypothetical protein BHE74_00038612 [Ensete ventricosum]|nr:hypothetical protein GW17_00036063 [Ensete ventricosum]RWW54786.1 hypothetical protein BHE74_00038612 [Ensete ventricosum]
MNGCERAVRCQEHCFDTKCSTLADSKLGGDHYRGSASLELYRGFLLQIDAQRL